FFSLSRRPPRSPPFPYTTLFRSERLLAAIRAMDRARSLTEIFDALSVGAEREAPRAAVLLVRDATLRGWRFTGFDAALEACESRSEEHTSELQSRVDLVCRLLLE